MTMEFSDERIVELGKELFGYCVGSCSCMTKTPETKYHKADCRYRVYQESFFALTILLRERNEWRDAFDIKAEESSSHADQCLTLHTRIGALRQALYEIDSGFYTGESIARQMAIDAIRKDDKFDEQK